MALAASVTLRRASPADLPLVLAVERVPGSERFVGRWSEARHRAALADPTVAYLVGARSGQPPEACAILRHLDDEAGNTCLHRIAVLRPDQGLGTPFLAAVIDWVFERTETHRLWLDVIDENARAQHVYLKAGFRKEGTLREATTRLDGARADLLLMSLLRPEWEAARGAGGRHP